MTVDAPDATATTSGALRRAFVVAPALRQGLGVTITLAVIGTALQIVVPVTVQQIIDRGILRDSGVDLGQVVTRGGFALAAMVAAMVAMRIALARLATFSAAGLSDLRVTTFGHIQRMSALHVQADRRGSLVSRVTSDVSTIQDFMDWGGVALLIGVSQISLAMLVMFIYKWSLALLVVVGVAIYAVLLAWFQRILKRAHDKVRARVADSYSALGEAISGLPVVRAYGAEEATLGRVRGALDRQFGAEFRAASLGALLFSSAEVFAGAITATIIAAGVILGVGAGTTAGTLLAFLFLVNLLVEPVQMLVETLDSTQAAAAGLRRVLAVLDSPIEIADPSEPLPLPEGRLDVRFERVRFRYHTGPDVLHDVDAHVAPGSRIAVVGETGSGKTTFAKLATRLLDPTAGEIRIGEVPLRKVRLSELRRRVAFVPQEGFLFDATIAGNVRYGRPDATDAEVRAAFSDLGLEPWLDALPDGLNTQLGERGGQVSAGERQLVALVRAWIADPDLLVLDEATSAVDPALEVQLRRAIEHLSEDRTSITVAHRLATAEAADQILVFDEGRIVEVGPHAQLLAAGGSYARLHADWASGTTAVTG